MIILTLIISTQFYKIWPNLFYFIFLLQKMDNKVNIKKAEIAEIILKSFRSAP